MRAKSRASPTANCSTNSMKRISGGQNGGHPEQHRAGVGEITLQAHS